MRLPDPDQVLRFMTDDFFWMEKLDFVINSKKFYCKQFNCFNYQVEKNYSPRYNFTFSILLVKAITYNIGYDILL